jgi:hypothetical protein
MKKWTIMLYLAGDNNLSEDMITSLLGMQKAMKTFGADNEIGLTAIYDSGYPTAKIETYSFTKSNSSGSLQDCLVTLPTGQFHQTHSNSDETAYIKGFIESVSMTEELKAENYALILSGHSDAVLGKTMFRDSNPETKLHLEYLSKILEDAAEFLPKKKFDLLGFDSCMMGMLEVGCQLKKTGDILVSSQGFAPTAGWDYYEILTELFARKGQMNAVELGISITDNQINSAKNYRIGGRSMNLSTVDLTKAIDLKTAVNDLGVIFNKILCLPDNPTEQTQINAVLIECIKNLIQESHYYSQTFLHEQAVDIRDFAATLIANCDLKLTEMSLLLGATVQTEAAVKITKELNLIKNQCLNIKNAVKNYVVKNRSSGSDYQFSEGVSVFFPWTMLALNMVFKRYEKLEFSVRGEWFEFVEKFTKLTLRANGEPRYSNGRDLAEWKSDVETANKASTAKDAEARASTAKASTAKAETEMFYKLFGRFRNHPIYHEVER